ncbi:MAG: imidazole glycerol phosphate synthase subunit HisF [Bacteroidetes bacterium]|nr:imidazole glycerol phosphate synthase subunit HisF [Bacteroidota bacterium]
MYRPRIIPVLLLKNNGLVKSIQFKNHKYIGDPMNAVRIYNELEADEIIFLDIEATKNNRCVDVQLVKDIGEEANMPFGVGGGINSLSQIEKLIHAGAEKVVICSEALHRPEFIQEASQEFGSSTIAVCMDVGKSFFGGTKLYSHSGSKAHSIELESFAKKMQDFGAGELIIQSIVQDGKMTGYNHEISAAVAKKINIPVTVLGGAGTMEDIKSLHQQHPFNGYAAGSLFVYQGKHRGVLINYPSQEIKVKSTTLL